MYSCTLPPLFAKPHFAKVRVLRVKPHFAKVRVLRVRLLVSAGMAVAAVSAGVPVPHRPPTLLAVEKVVEKVGATPLAVEKVVEMVGAVLGWWRGRLVERPVLSTATHTWRAHMRRPLRCMRQPLRCSTHDRQATTVWLR